MDALFGLGLILMVTVTILPALVDIFSSAGRKYRSKAK